jgi:uncharacterized protein
MAPEAALVRVGVISDTHGLLRPEALAALRGVELILHAGDIGTPVVLLGLGALAPVKAVRGNCDRGEWCDPYPERLTLQIAGVEILVLHDRHELLGEPPGAAARVVVSGHSHKPSLEERDGVLYLNPGSAGRRRFHLPVTLALLTLEKGRARAEIVELMGEHAP